MDTQVVAISIGIGGVLFSQSYCLSLIGTALAGVMICLTAVLVLMVVVRQCHAHRKKRSAGMGVGVVCDCVSRELSSSTSDSV